MSRNFIQSAIQHPGALHAQMGVPQGRPIPKGKLAHAAHAPGKLGQRARFAELLAQLRKHRHGGHPMMARQGGSSSHPMMNRRGGATGGAKIARRPNHPPSSRYGYLD